MLSQSECIRQNWLATYLRTENRAELYTPRGKILEQDLAARVRFSLPTSPHRHPYKNKKLIITSNISADIQSLNNM